MENRKLEIPVLIITFNRPDVTRVVLDRILEMNPPKLYFFNDAPRPGNENDEIKCREIREMAKSLSFSGELVTRFEPQNLGCKLGESTAMGWLFENEEMGIVIEDDILPSPDFFFYCQEMLHKYKDDPRVFSITGCNLVNEWKSDINDYHFALFGSFWGWAGWQRVWKMYDVTMKAWNDPEVKRLAMNLLPFNEYKDLRTKEFDALVNGRANTWDFQFCLLHYLNHAMSVVPSRNMITNIGIQHSDAVHMVGESPFSDLRHHPVKLPMKHNPVMIPDYDYDFEVVKKAYPWLFENQQAPVPVQKKNSLIQKIKNKIG
jgi:hypothetical protein